VDAIIPLRHASKKQRNQRGSPPGSGNKNTFFSWPTTKCRGGDEGARKSCRQQALFFSSPFLPLGGTGGKKKKKSMARLRLWVGKSLRKTQGWRSCLDPFQDRKKLGGGTQGDIWDLRGTSLLEGAKGKKGDKKSHKTPEDA